MTARNSQPDSSTANPPPAPELVFDYRAREQFFGFHARGERFACIVTHRRAGKTVACIQALQRAALTCPRVRPRFASASRRASSGRSTPLFCVKQGRGPPPPRSVEARIKDGRSGTLPKAEGILKSSWRSSPSSSAMAMTARWRKSFWRRCAPR